MSAIHTTQLLGIIIGNARYVYYNNSQVYYNDRKMYYNNKKLYYINYKVYVYFTRHLRCKVRVS